MNQLKESETYTVKGKYRSSHGDSKKLAIYCDLTCSKCGSSKFKLKYIDSSCFGCGHGGVIYAICDSCGEEYDVEGGL